MSDGDPRLGSLAWLDLAVENGEVVRDFYREVVGGEAQPATGAPAPGICSSRGNPDLDAAWLSYIAVADLDLSLARCEQLGGTVVERRGEPGASGRLAIIRDPAGAAFVLVEQPAR